MRCLPHGQQNGWSFLKEVAAKNADVEGAVDTLALHIKEGSAGVWGPIPMPANAVTEEAKILAEWV